MKNQPSNSLTLPLVGAHFRPPAKQVLAALPAGAELILEPEPDNPYDSKAVRVLVVPGEVIPLAGFEAFAASLEGTGFDAHEVMAAWDGLHVGYLPDSDGKVCRQAGCPGNREAAEACAGDWGRVRASLGFSSEGKPQVIVTIAPGETV